jgi:hypothetical protein
MLYQAKRFAIQHMKRIPVGMIAFDRSANARATTVLINEDGGEARFVIGPENSLLHENTRFQV